ncbi:hypothetical protein ABG980_17230 [Enterococcus casseliflavus]|jgi:hypothetical protein|uniref:hypothetical protein n=1 Tax=Enterococcus TaxID=1350 RepID=UPI00232CCE88|nr:hypothetical protein [Enterococcus casseliflavus]MDB1695466.1 hypothetical protein [Enterococcus casseliflavus]MDB1698899.1 hypothetical protein [Enterococcus casseliflavus]MDB1703594.1 hypothetical protein [Enterococcus casseliflavus]MDB1706428.1 hypothetical protein [Enterococcus casseliflavus]MEB6181080.1 hypothetical protein [Enterococcus casseliflavus]
MLNLKTNKQTLEKIRKARMVNVRFFSDKAGNTLERALIIDVDEKIEDVLNYLEESIDNINIIHYTTKDIYSIVNISELEDIHDYVKLEHYWGDVISYVIEYKDCFGFTDELCLVANIDCDNNDLITAVNNLNESFEVVNIYEYRDCWVKRP